MYFTHFQDFDPYKTCKTCKNYKNQKKLYYFKCKTKTSTKDPTEVTTKNGRLMMKGLCDACGVKKNLIRKAVWWWP